MDVGDKRSTLASRVFSHLVAGEEGGGAEQLRDAPEGLLLSGLSGREVERRDHVVVSEAGVGAGVEKSLNGRDVPAERRVVKGRPTHLKQSSEKKNRAGGGGVRGYIYIYGRDAGGSHFHQQQTASTYFQTESADNHDHTFFVRPHKIAARGDILAKESKVARGCVRAQCARNGQTGDCQSFRESNVRGSAHEVRGGRHRFGSEKK